MSIAMSPWEHQLIELAYAGLESAPDVACTNAEAETLRDAYAHCAEITRAHSHTFYLASGLLPSVKRRAVRALYAFCRISDNIVDQADRGDDPNVLEALETWRLRSLGNCTLDNDLLVIAWKDTRATYNIPRVYSEQLLDGIARDLVQTRYPTFIELTAYCYAVASTVGLMAMHITGFSGEEALPYAVKLGVALQLTNILRDVAEDWQTGRLYLPQEELADFDLTEADIEARHIDDRWRAFMAFQIQRVRALYAASLPGVKLLHRDGRFAIAAAAELYRGILDDIEAHDMDVFHRRAYISTSGKLKRLPGIWWRANVGGYGRE